MPKGGRVISRSWRTRPVVAFHPLSGMYSGNMTGSTKSAFPGEGQRSSILLSLGDVLTALVVAQDLEIAVRIELAADAGAISRCRQVISLVAAGIARISGGIRELLGERRLFPFVGAGHIRETKLPDGRVWLHPMGEAGNFGAPFRRR